VTTPNTPDPTTPATPPDLTSPAAGGTAAGGTAAGGTAAGGAVGIDPNGADGTLGALEIHPTVVRKVAAHAVRLVPGAEPSAAVRIGEAGGDLELAVRLALRYPAPIRPAAADVRRRVTEEVERITGFRVRSVAVTVSALRAETVPRVG
jgi:uncharacterized alkaline shock family protein YloU